MWKLHLQVLLPSEWRNAETGFLYWDALVSSKAEALCHKSLLCFPVLDFLVESVSSKLILAILLTISFWKQLSADKKIPHAEKWRDYIFFVAVFFLGDFVCNLLKSVFARLRPWQSLEYFESVKIVSFSLPSNHSFNLAMIAMYWTIYFRRRALKSASAERGLWGIAILVSICRVFQGRHYPLDVVAGLFFGALFAVAASRFYLVFDKIKFGRQNGNL